VSFAAVNVENLSVGDKLQKLTGQLLCQENARSNHHNGLRSFRLQLTQSIVDHLQSLTTASGDNDLTLSVLCHCSDSTFLMGAELNHRSHRVWEYYSTKRGPAGPRVPVMKVVGYYGFL